MSILGRMLFLLCLFLFATMSIVGGFAYFNYRENCRIGELGVQRAALGVAEYAQMFLHTVENSVRQLARAPEIVKAVGSLPPDMGKGARLIGGGEPLSPAAAALRTLLETTLYGNPRGVQVGFRDMRGGFLSSPALGVVLAADPGTRPWYAEALRVPAGTVVRTTYLSAPGNVPVFAFSQAVRKDGEPVGVVYMEVPLRAFMQSLAVLSPGTSGVIYVLDKDGVVLAAPAAHESPAQGDGGNAVPPELTDADDGSYYSSIGGIQSFWAVHTDNHGFRYIVVMDAEEMLHDSNMLLLRSCIGAGLVLLIILVAGYAIAGSAVLPLARLESAANAIADGRPDATFPDASEFSGEIRGLRNAMARMLLSQRAALSAAQRAAQQASANEHYALAALRDVSRRHGDCRNKLEALRLAAHDLSAAVENLPDAVDDEDRARRVKEALKASRWFMALAGNSCREEGAPGEPPADAGTSARE